LSHIFGNTHILGKQKEKKIIPLGYNLYVLIWFYTRMVIIMCA